jgi:hypothetical protein
LVVPGLAFLAYSVFSLYATMLEDQRGMNAILRSLDLVMNHFWAVLGRLGVVILLSLPVLAVALVVNVFGTLALQSVPFHELIVAIPVQFILMTLTALTGAMLAYVYAVRAESTPLFDMSQYGGIRVTFWLMFCLGLLIPVGLVLVAGLNATAYISDFQQKYMTNLSEYAVTADDDTQDINDFVAQARVDTMFTAGKRYYSRILTYEGVCSDVVIQKPAVCRSTEETFVVYTPLSNGKYYCRDTDGYKAVQAARPDSPLTCK